MIKPKLDVNFYPMILALRDFQKRVELAPESDRAEISLIAERNGGFNYVYTYTGLKDGVNDKLNYRVAERLVKTVLWVCGGYKIFVAGSKYIYERLKKAYSPAGERAFDEDFMSGVYEKPFEVLFLETKDVPAQKNASVKVG